MGLDHAELYGIDLDQLKQESFNHMAHFRMVRDHNQRAKEWFDLVARHTEDNATALTSSSIITSTEKNGN